MSSPSARPDDMASLATRWTVRPSSVVLAGGAAVTPILGADVNRWCILLSNPIGVPGLNAFAVPQQGGNLVQFALAVSALRFDQKDFGALVAGAWSVNNQGAGYTIGVLELLWN